jgi:hypothetical protein
VTDRGRHEDHTAQHQRERSARPVRPSFGDVRPLAPALKGARRLHLLCPSAYRDTQLKVAAEGFGVDLVAPTVQQLRELGT